MNRSESSANNMVITLFINHLKKEKLSYGTQKAYLIDIQSFFRSFDPDLNKFDNSSLAGYTTEQIESYLQTLSNLKNSHSTLKRSIAALRRFFGFLQQEGIISHNPAESLQRFAKPKTSLSIVQVSSILKYVTDHQPAKIVLSFRYVRDELILLLMLLYGVRQYQIPLLKLSSFQFKPGSVILMVKKEFGITLEKATLEAARRYLKMRNSSIQTLFLDSTQSKPITLKDLQNLLVELECALQLKLSPTLLYGTSEYLRQHPDERSIILELVSSLHLTKNSQEYANA